MEDNFFYCSLCNYKTNRNYNLKRHHNAVHLKNNEDFISKKSAPINICLAHPSIEIVNLENFSAHSTKNIAHSEIPALSNKDNEKNTFHCKKCNKEYKTKKLYIKHEEKCNGLNILTCPRCMFTFSTKNSKSNHIKRNNCKAKSIIHAIKPDNIITIINNYGFERNDYITFDDIFNILTKSGIYIISKYIEMKHFNKDFPENHNIKCENNNDCLIKKDDEWKVINLNYITDTLIYNNSKEIHRYYNNKEKEIENKLQNTDKINEIYSYFNFTDLHANKEIYNIIKCEIKNIIKTTKYINKKYFL